MQRVGRLLRAILAVAFTAVFLAGAIPSAAQPVDIVRVGVGPDSLTYTPFFLADKLGFFRAEGINVRFVTMNSAALMVAPLGIGQLDGSARARAISAGLYNAVTRGIDVRIVADLGSDPPQYGFQTFVVRKSLIASGGFKSLKDLKGKADRDHGARSISTSALVAALLRKAGLTLDDVKLVYLPVSDQIVALGNGAIDASLMPEPGPTIAQKANVAVKIMHDDAFYPNQQLIVVLYGATLLRDHRDVGVRFMRAYLKAVRLYNDNLKDGKIAGSNADNIMTIFAAQTHQDRSVLGQVTPPGIDPNGHLNLISMRSDYDFFKQQGMIDGKTGTPGDAVDSSFVTEALKTMGVYKH